MGAPFNTIAAALPTLAWAVSQIGASRYAVAAVWALMEDGVPRVDEEIAAVIRRADGRLYAPDTIRHARLALVMAGHLKWTGGVKKTFYGKPTQVWVFAKKRTA